MSKVQYCAKVGSMALALLVSVLMDVNTCRCQEDATSRLVIPEGKKQLFRKVIIKDDTTMLKNMGDVGGPAVTAFSLFFLLKGDDGALVTKDYVRVGTSTGKHLGWIKESDVFYWDSRFLLKPDPPTPGRTFSVYQATTLTGDHYELKGYAKTEKVVAPITETKGSEKESVYKVVFFAGKVPSRTGAAIEPKTPEGDLKELKMDFVFVIDTTGSMQPVIDGTIEVMKECALQIARLPGLQGKDAVRFGVVEFRDKGDDFVSRVASDLTSNVDSFISKLRGLSAAGGGDDAEQVLDGLKTAIQNMSWSKVSAKNIILLGDAPAHLKDDGTNTTDLTITDVINLGRTTGKKSDFQTLNKSINFHALLASSHGMAREQFQEITKNNGDFPGYFREFNANDVTSRNKTVEALVSFLSTGLKAFEGIRRGDASATVASVKDSEGQTDNPLVTQLYQFKGSPGEKEGTVPTKAGWTTEKGEDGRQVAQKMLMLTKVEVEKLADDLDYLHKRFSRLTTPEDRRNVSKLLDNLKGSAVARAAGQEVTADTDLQQLIGDLPLHTPALKTTIQRIAKMTTEEYTIFIGGLDQMRITASKLLQREDWIIPSSGFAPEEKYLFLRFSEMP